MTVLLAVLLDWWLGEPRRWHPLVVFGNWARSCEQRLYGAGLDEQSQRWRGVWALTAAVLPIAWLTSVLDNIPMFSWLLEVTLLYLAIGHRSLNEHAMAVFDALKDGDLDQARRAVGYIVSRDTADLDEAAVSRATVESVLENGNDAIFGAIFWFVVAGAPGVVLYRLVNTLDAMWGYKNERYLYFGWAAARLDDVLNFIPARLTALSYAVLGQCQQALACWKIQGRVWKSPNAGPVMAAGAGSLGVQLGGGAVYHGQWQERPELGAGLPVVVEDIERACALVRRTLVLWVVLIVLGCVLF